jgi:Domain of unknown function (DUF4384)
VSKDKIASVVSMDLNLGKLVTRQIIPGMSANNSIAVVREGKGADAGGVIGKAGLSFNVSFDRSEGFHQAVRNLVELSTIELLGKLTRVPYWQCLSIDQTNSTFKSEAREWFDAMGEREREDFARTNLTRLGYLGPAGEGGLREAIARYQAENDLIPSGRTDFDLYYRLLGAARAGRPVAVAAAAPPAQPPGDPTAPIPTAQAASVAAGPPSLALISERGPRPVYRPNEMLVLQAQANRDGFLYCYYQDAEGTVARIFPNRFQPDAFVKSGTPVQIPPAGPEQAFAIRFDRPGAREAVACVAAADEVGLKLPQELKRGDLEPLPARSLDDVLSAFRRVADGRASAAVIPIEVSQ